MVRINKVYTKAGDRGNTQLIGGEKVPKCNARIACYGTIDELNATLGMCLSALEDSKAGIELTPKLSRIQNELFNVGTQLATPDADRRAELPNIRVELIALLESDMDGLGEQLPDLTSFVLPGGSECSARFHIARTVCRRVERMVVELASKDDVEDLHVSYLNRLSDALFVFGRYCLHADGLPEQLWEPRSV
ncbi:MAG: cob(I)yrinic acid a,c-diamide adenosyltransferase [Myxococcales bacterium]|nr:cob(I)yrinic acid a,c-diamide adenosyltransferase [Myxococcales bacterium]